jgi:hypothetical protein
MSSYGELLDETDPQRWHWWGLAASRGHAGSFLSNFSNLVDRFESGHSLAPVVFVIGRALSGHVDMAKRLIFGTTFDFDSLIGPANRAVGFFTLQCAAARRAVDAWCLMAVRINSKVNRDIRKKIGMMIWELREQADYKVTEHENRGAKRA